MREGYTFKQSARLKEQIDRDVAMIEDGARRLRDRVPDVGTGSASVPHDIENLLEDFREVAHALKEVVDRRSWRNVT